MARDREQIELMLSAYLDDELTRDERAEVESLLASDEEARRLLDELRATADGLRALPRAKVSEEFSDALRSHLERRALLGGEPPRRMPRVAGPSTFGRRIAAAAVIALAGLAGYITYSFTREPARHPEYYAFKDETQAKPEAARQSGPPSPPASLAQGKQESDLKSSEIPAPKPAEDGVLGDAELAWAPADKAAPGPPAVPRVAVARPDDSVEVRSGRIATPRGPLNAMTAESSSQAAVAIAGPEAAPGSARTGRQFGDAVRTDSWSEPAAAAESAPTREVGVAQEQAHVADGRSETYSLHLARSTREAEPPTGPMPVLGPDLLDQATTAPFLVQVARTPSAGHAYIFQSPVATRPAASRPASAPATTRAACPPRP